MDKYTCDKCGYQTQSVRTYSAHIHNCTFVLKPPNWPNHVAFSSTLLHGNAGTNEQELSWGVEVRQLPAGHVAHPGFGLYATQVFSVGDIIAPYVGRVLEDFDDAGGPYTVFTGTIVIDSQLVGNETRMINSSHGTGAPSNAKLWVEDDEMSVLVEATRDIHVGEEITISYPVH